MAASYSGPATAANKPGALDPKAKDLMALAIGIAIRCDGCIGFHTEAAIQYGATRDEIVETIGVAVYKYGGLPTLMLRRSNKPSTNSPAVKPGSIVPPLRNGL